MSSPTIAATAMAISVTRSKAFELSPRGARIETTASRGTIIRSSSRRIETAFWPSGVEVSPRSSSICVTIAVEDRTKPIPATKAVAGGRLEQEQRGRGEQRAADKHVGQPETEDRTPQCPQPARLHLQSYDEQKHDDAEFGDVENGFGIGEKAKSERADDEAGSEITEHRTEAEPSEDRHRHDTRAK